MSQIVLQGDVSGSAIITTLSAAGTPTLTLPTTSGTILTTATGQTLTSPVFAGTPTGVGVLTSDTAQATTSGTFKDFTGIPSWVKRITVMFNGVSLSGTSQIQIQLGDSGGIETTGYTSGAWVNNAGATSTTGLLCTGGFIAAWTYTGIAIISTMNSNVWISSSNGANSSNLVQGAGSKTLSDTLNQIRITTLNGTDTFDAGSINILYE